MSRSVKSSPKIAVPPSIAQGEDPMKVQRWALEALVVEAVREGRISRGKGGEILGLSFAEREQFYADRGVLYNFTMEELDRDLRSLRVGLGKQC